MIEFLLSALGAVTGLVLALYLVYPLVAGV